MNPHLRIFGMVCLLLTSYAMAADSASPTADDLFEIVSTIRSEAEADRPNDPRHYSREWLELALRDIASSRAERQSDLNYERDALLASFSTFQVLDAVYKYEMVSTPNSPVSLQLRASSCGTPYLLTIGFRYEDGMWRLSHYASSTAPEHVSWYRVGLKPVQTWAPIPPRDRSRYLSESNLGQALGLSINPKNGTCL